MATATQSDRRGGRRAIPATMRAAVYYGKDDVRLETVPVPEIAPGEVLLRVHTCGVCGTDLKKIASGSHSAPRIFGHETVGVVAAVGEGVRGWSIGDRVMSFHHVPCGECFYCCQKLFAQCPLYKKVGCTAGFEPSGGGFAEYVRIMDWIVERGLIRIPAFISFEQASFIEPVNTCMKAVARLNLKAGESVLVIGQGPIGLLLAYLAARSGARVIASDLYAQRLTMSKSLGLLETIDASRSETVQTVRELTEGRGTDAVILAAAADSLIKIAIDAARPGGRVMLFAQTAHGQVVIDPTSICVEEKSLIGSYSAAADLQDESVRFVFRGDMDLERLITHRFPLERAVEALEFAAHPHPDSLKVLIQPGSNWEGNSL